jgi:hypothetical protein
VKATASSSQDGAEPSKKTRTFAMLDQLMDKMPPRRVSALVDSEVGSILHYFAAIDYAIGIGVLTSASYGHPPDMPNKKGITPVQMAMQTRSHAALRLLLDCAIDVNAPCYILIRLTPLQRIEKKWSTADDLNARTNLSRIKADVKFGKHVFPYLKIAIIYHHCVLLRLILMASRDSLMRFRCSFCDFRFIFHFMDVFTLKFSEKPVFLVKSILTTFPPPAQHYWGEK